MPRIPETFAHAKSFKSATLGPNMGLIPVYAVARRSLPSYFSTAISTRGDQSEM
jgi:hypothetical protein